MTQLPDPLGYAVHDLIQLLILLLEKDVHGMEIGAFYIPVRIPGLGIQDKLICQQLTQFYRYSLKVFGTNTDVCVHLI